MTLTILQQAEEEAAGRHCVATESQHKQESAPVRPLFAPLPSILLIGFEGIHHGSGKVRVTCNGENYFGATEAEAVGLAVLAHKADRTLTLQFP